MGCASQGVWNPRASNPAVFPNLSSFSTVDLTGVTRWCFLKGNHRQLPGLSIFQRHRLTEAPSTQPPHDGCGNDKVGLLDDISFQLIL